MLLLAVQKEITKLNDCSISASESITILKLAVEMPANGKDYATSHFQDTSFLHL